MASSRSKNFVSWHKDSDFIKAVEEFHYRNARVPREQYVEKANKLHFLYTEELQRRLAARGVCSRLEYKGSSYEGVKVRRTAEDPDLEFDIMVILRCGAGLQLQVEPITVSGRPGYVQLRVTSGTSAQTKKEEPMDQFTRKALDHGLLSAGKLANGFMSELQQCVQKAWCDNKPTTNAEWTLKQLRNIRDRTKLRYHGPAVQMDVKHPDTDELFYSVDMVPTIQIPGRNGDDRYYIAKPTNRRRRRRKVAWQQSFSLQEKELIVTCDADNGCRKQVLRILNVIRKRESIMSSFHFKTALLRTADKLSNPALWRSDCLAQRLIDVIGQMEEELGEGSMPHYFLPEIDLLDGMRDSAIEHMRRRMKNLKNKKGKMMKMLCK